MAGFDVHELRKQFPILQREIKGKQLVYLDNAATTQKPKVVIDAITEYYTTYNANIHRGIHALAEEATEAFEATRESVRAFINAKSIEEIIFTKGTTESINLVSNSWGRKNLEKGDEIIISTLEHHSNIVPWQLIAEERGAIIKVIPIHEDGQLNMDVFQQLLNEKTKIVSVVFASNALGVINPIKEIITKSHEAGALVMVDAAQAVAHLDIDVISLDCDFMAFSAHKMYGPTGAGVLYGKKDILENMPPFMGGGEMIREVSFEKTTYNDLPYKFEAGTPNIADIIAMKPAIEFIQNLGKTEIRRHEQDVLEYATQQVSEIKGLDIKGNVSEKVSVLSFYINNTHPQDIGILLDNQGIAVRTGNHCTMPLMQCLNIPGTTRASFSVYNTREEVDQLVAGLHKVIKMLS